MTPKTIQNYLRLFNINTNKDEIKFRITCHPYFLNIYGVKKFFEDNGLPSDCIRLKNNSDLRNINKPFIAATRNGIIPIIGHKKDNVFALVDGRKKKFDFAFFEGMFDL
ncbi:hypothetical protein [Porphyromonas loveana]|uniref:hypothetical protein n=1 Tax=Porphyromonas loveana TaxID=1884669 RepID=UPI0035A1A87C